MKHSPYYFWSEEEKKTREARGVIYLEKENILEEDRRNRIYRIMLTGTSVCAGLTRKVVDGHLVSLDLGSGTGCFWGRSLSINYSVSIAHRPLPSVSLLLEIEYPITSLGGSVDCLAYCHLWCLLSIYSTHTHLPRHTHTNTNKRNTQTSTYAIKHTNTHTHLGTRVIK